MIYLPTEDEESCALAEYLELKKYKFTHIPNETYTPSFKTKAKNKKMGVSRGVPDYMIIIDGDSGKSYLVFIELKRKKKYKKSEEQKEWIKALNKVDNVQGYFACGADEAIEIIERIKKL